MAKIYTSKPLAAQEMLPSKETIRFLLAYSKALYVVRKGRLKLETISN